MDCLKTGRSRTVGRVLVLDNKEPIDLLAALQLALGLLWRNGHIAPPPAGVPELGCALGVPASPKARPKCTGRRNWQCYRFTEHCQCNGIPQCSA